MLADVEGFGETHRGAQLMCEFKRFRQDVVSMANTGGGSGSKDDNEENGTLEVFMVLLYF